VPDRVLPAPPTRALPEPLPLRRMIGPSVADPLGWGR